MSTGEIIRKAREAAGLQQADVAKALGVGQPVISKIETGKRAPTLHQAAALADLLRVDPADLLRVDYQVRPAVVS